MRKSLLRHLLQSVICFYLLVILVEAAGFISIPTTTKSRPIHIPSIPVPPLLTGLRIEKYPSSTLFHFIKAAAPRLNRLNNERGNHEEGNGQADSSQKQEGPESGPTPFLQLYQEFKAIRINELNNTQDVNEKLEFANKFLAECKQLFKDSTRLEGVVTDYMDNYRMIPRMK